MFERFSGSARQTVVLAQSEARSLNHSAIGTEHLLLALLRTSGVAAMALANVGIDYDRAREWATATGSTESPVEHMPFTPLAKQTLELSLREALNLSDSTIASQHLLLGLVRLAGDAKTSVFSPFAVPPEAVRSEVLRLLESGERDPDDIGEPTLRRTISSSSPFEPVMGYSRAVRVLNTLAISGTAPQWPDGHVDPDVETQARRVFEIIGEALHQAGARFEHVVRTRVFLVDAKDFDAVARVHGEVFADIRPANTTVIVAALLNPAWKLEVEVDAVIA